MVKTYINRQYETKVISRNGNRPNGSDITHWKSYFAFSLSAIIDQIEKECIHGQVVKFSVDLKTGYSV